jgi:hypothetical protein
VANVTDLRIDIASEFTGAKAFKKAQDSTFNLEKSVKNLGKTLGIALSARAVVNFSKQSVKAFAADDKAARTLANTLTNLGLAFEDTRVRSFIDNLERTYGVLDDDLRPAFQRLLTTTGSVTKAQDILKNALDLSAAGYGDVVSISSDLSKAYVGQTRSLAKYGLGLSQAELKGMKFEEVQGRINKLFGGQAAALADTYAVKIDKIAAASERFKEAVGKGLIDGLTNLNGGGQGGLEKSITLIDRLGIGIGKLIANMGVGAGQGLLLLQGDIAGAKALGDAALRGKTDKNAIIPSIADALSTKVWEDRMKALREEAAMGTKITAEKKKQLALDKAKASLAKAQANFDITKINLAAALKGKVSEDEKNRLLALQAIENGNGEEALKYIAKIDAAREAAAAKEAARQKLSYEDALAKIKALNDAISSRQQYLLGVGMGGSAAPAAPAASESPTNANGSSLDALAKLKILNAEIASRQNYLLGVGMSSPESLGLSDRANTERNAAMNIVLNIDGTQVSNALYNNSNSGTASSSSRSTGTFSA